MENINIVKQLNIFGGVDEVDARSPLEILKSRPAPDKKSPVVVSYGGGRNSTALLILCQRLGIKVDLILFADTGGEKPETYEFIEIFNTWLIQNKMPCITYVRRKVSNISPDKKTWVSAKQNLFLGLKHPLSNTFLAWLIWWCAVAGHKSETLEENCLVSQTLPSKAFGRSSCSVAWKIEPQDEFTKSWKPGCDARKEGILIRKFIGYHVGEVRRLIDKKTKQMRDLESDGFRYEYPLMEYGLDDWDCIRLIESTGLPVPPKSSCFFCPSSRISEIRNLPEELRLRADLMESTYEKGIHYRNGTTIVGLGRKFRWQDIDKLTELEEAAIAFQQQSRGCLCID